MRRARERGNDGDALHALFCSAQGRSTIAADPFVQLIAHYEYMTTDDFSFTFMSVADARLAKSLSALARCNPFLPERIDRERDVLGDTFEHASSVWSKRARRRNPNVVKLAARAEALADKLRTQGATSPPPSEAERQLYEELVFHVLYYKFEKAFDRARGARVVDFYDEFCVHARAYLSAVPPRHGPRTATDCELTHWFALLFQLRRASHHIFDFIVGSSLPAARLRAAIWQSIFTHDLRRYRRSLFERMGDVATLITGPSGTGKELVAQAVGLSGYIPFDPRQKRFTIDSSEAFFPLNLSALAEPLIESELFGHRRGAFTGASSDHKGWLSVCPKLGTVFLDEIGELASSLQVKLLRVIQTRTFQPLGETRYRSFAGKIVAATNRDLMSEMRTGSFRSDLYFRLCSDLITTPTLKEQLEDAPDDLDELVLFIARRVVGDDEATSVADEVSEWMRGHLDESYPWPGNVRELEQCIRNVLIRRDYRTSVACEFRRDAVVDLSATSLTADELVERYCAVAYDRSGSYVEAARRLGIDRRTVKTRVDAFRRRQ